MWESIKKKHVAGSPAASTIAQIFDMLEQARAKLILQLNIETLSRKKKKIGLLTIILIIEKQLSITGTVFF